jgi:hypothetical protein
MRRLWLVALAPFLFSCSSPSAVSLTGVPLGLETLTFSRGVSIVESRRPDSQVTIEPVSPLAKGDVELWVSVKNTSPTPNNFGAPQVEVALPGRPWMLVSIAADAVNREMTEQLGESEARHVAGAVALQSNLQTTTIAPGQRIAGKVVGPRLQVEDGYFVPVMVRVSFLDDVHLFEFDATREKANDTPRSRSAELLSVPPPVKPPRASPSMSDPITPVPVPLAPLLRRYDEVLREAGSKAGTN